MVFQMFEGESSKLWWGSNPPFRAAVRSARFGVSTVKPSGGALSRRTFKAAVLVPFSPSSDSRLFGAGLFARLVSEQGSMIADLVSGMGAWPLVPMMPCRWRFLFRFRPSLGAQMSLVRS
jgi:hypothetical protein